MHDSRTNTLAGAADFERVHFGGYVERDHTVGVDEIAQIEYERRAEAARGERERAARARGEYVPSSAMKIAASCCSMALAQRGVFGIDVEPILHKGREGVVRVAPESATAPRATAQEVAEALAFCYPDSQPTPYDGGIWARIVPFGEEA